MATWNMITLPDGASPIMSQLLHFHDHVMMIIIIITVLVGYMMTTLFFNKYTDLTLTENQTIETIWTILPAITLIFIALPSLKLLYLMDEVGEPQLTVKAIGHQWYWSYEYTDFQDLEFDSYMIPVNELNDNSFRLLDVDNRVVMPYNTSIRMVITAADVIHSWAVPSLGVKMDATPGRLNQVGMTITRPGLFFGQCSEICGANHSFMPIVIESVSPKYFINWITKMTQ